MPETARAEQDFDDLLNDVVAAVTGFLQAEEFENAAAEFEGFLPECKQKPRTEAWARNWLADIRRVQGEYRQALQQLDAARALIDQGPPESNVCQRLRVDNHNQRARVFLDWGLLDLAWRSLVQASEQLANLRNQDLAIDKEILAVNYTQITLLAAREDWQARLAVSKATLADERNQRLYEVYPASYAQYLAKLGAGQFEMSRLDPSLAPECRSQLEAALAVEELPGLDRCEPLMALARLDMRDHDWSSAEEHLERAGAALGPAEERRNIPFSYAKWLALSACLDFERTDKPVPRETLQLHRRALEGAIDDEIKRWKRRELREGGYGFLSYNPSQILLSEWIRLTLHLESSKHEGAQAALNKLLEVQAVGTLARRLGGVATAVEGFRKSWIGADEKHLVLVYLPASDRSHLFVLDSERVTHEELGSGDSIEQGRRVLEESIQVPLGKSAFEWQREKRLRALERVSQQLLPEAVAKRLAGCERLTLVGLDLLGEVPFEALSLVRAGARPDSKADSGEASEETPRTLGTELAITYLPSLAVGAALTRRAHAGPLGQPSGAQALLVGSPDPEQPLISPAAFDAMLAVYEDRATVLSGKAATFDALCRHAPSTQVLQLYTHGGVEPSWERPVAFELALDEGTALYGAGNVEQQLESPEVVLLTVCGSGRGPRRRGDASAGDLASAFLLAGRRTRCVVTCAFELEAHAAQRIATRFHAQLLAGQSPAEALRRARAELAQDPDFADPFYHGLIRVIGLGHLPVFALPAAAK